MEVGCSLGHRLILTMLLCSLLCHQSLLRLGEELRATLLPLVQLREVAH